jgi:hypothetical protein
VDEIAPSISRPGVLPAAAAAAARLGPTVDLDGFRLAGGTALAWHLGHRISEDLDFFTFNPHRLDATGADRLATQLRLADSHARVLKVSEQTVHGVIADCKVSFFEVSAQWIAPPVRVREGFDLASVLDVAAMKLIAVMTRCTKKDFFDIVAIEDAGVSAREMYEAGSRMYPGFSDARSHLLRSLSYFDEAETDPDPLGFRGISWSAVKQRMRVIARSV